LHHLDLETKAIHFGVEIMSHPDFVFVAQDKFSKFKPYLFESSQEFTDFALHLLRSVRLVATV
jgi:hypothetical protein